MPPAVADNTKTQRFTFGPVKASVTFIGYTCPDWCGQYNRPTYHVSISHASSRYTCNAWGSIADIEEGREDRHECMAAMVIDELHSASCDPDEFWSLAVGDKCPSRERAAQIEKIILAAPRFGSCLSDAVDIIRERGLS